MRELDKRGEPGYGEAVGGCLTVIWTGVSHTLIVCVYLGTCM